MSDKSLGIGIVGAGKAGMIFGRALEAIPQGRVVGFCTAHHRTAEEAARMFGAQVATTDLNLLLDNEEVEVVIVASRDEFHCRQVLAAARA